VREGQADEAEMMRRQVLAMWPGQTDATYLLLMAYTFGNLDLAIAHVREACQSPRAWVVWPRWPFATACAASYRVGRIPASRTLQAGIRDQRRSQRHP
jgi:hypothetical protein